LEKQTEREQKRSEAFEKVRRGVEGLKRWLEGEVQASAGGTKREELTECPGFRITSSSSSL
jgi:hypothetical protein